MQEGFRLDLKDYKEAVFLRVLSRPKQHGANI
jgi:hypothetical protein